MGDAVRNRLHGNSTGGMKSVDAIGTPARRDPRRASSFLEIRSDFTMKAFQLRQLLVSFDKDHPLAEDYVGMYWRRLRQDGAVPEGSAGRGGVGSAEISPIHAAALLVAMAEGRLAKEAAQHLDGKAVEDLSLLLGASLPHGRSFMLSLQTGPFSREVMIPAALIEAVRATFAGQKPGPALLRNRNGKQEPVASHAL